MKKNSEIIKSYSEVVFDIKDNTNLSIFIVNNDPVCMQIIRKRIPKGIDLSIYTFENEKDCLNKLSLKPDLILLNYESSKKESGSTISNKIKKKSPRTKIMMISSDYRLLLLEIFPEKELGKVFPKEEYLTEEMSEMVVDF